MRKATSLSNPTASNAIKKERNAPTWQFNPLCRTQIMFDARKGYQRKRIGPTLQKIIEWTNRAKLFKSQQGFHKGECNHKTRGNNEFSDETRR